MIIPLINSKGNFTRFESSIMEDGMEEGGTENNNPRAEKQSPARTIPNIKTKNELIFKPTTIPTKSGIVVIVIPKIKEASMSPSRIVSISKGDDINLSKVFILASQGKIMGDTEVDPKKRVIPRRPEKRNSLGIFLPTEYAKKKNKGINIPKMITGPLR